MKNTALTDTHIKLGAKMVPFAGYNMPVQYN
ncbi:aminomethyltransferase folate-binding domain-containing protein, partial [Mucilaginibacter auburnensis]